MAIDPTASLELIDVWTLLHAPNLEALRKKMSR